MRVTSRAVVLTIPRPEVYLWLAVRASAAAANRCLRRHWLDVTVSLGTAACLVTVAAIAGAQAWRAGYGAGQSSAVESLGIVKRWSTCTARIGTIRCAVIRSGDADILVVVP